MKKRLLAFLLAMAWLFCCACARHAETPTAVSASPTPAVTAAPEIAACAPTPVQVAAAPTRQFGEERRIVVDGDGFSGTLRYPLCGVRPINWAVADWASGTAYALETRAAAESADEDGMRATMEIDYDAYLYDGRFVGIKETGTYRATVSGEAEPILCAFNYDLAASKRLSLADVIDPEEIDAVSKLISERVSWLGATTLCNGESLTAATMQDFVIRDDGIEWLFYGKDCTVGVLIDYGALAPFLALPTPAPGLPGADGVSEEAAMQRAVSLHDGVHVRSLPSASEGEALAILNAGDALEVIEPYTVKGWHAVLLHEKVAFVNASLVQLTAEDTAYTDGWVTSGYLHVRSRANAQSELLGTMVFQERVRVIDPNAIDGWYKIWYEGDVAYVCARYVSLDRYPPEAQAAPAAPDVGETYAPPRILRQTLAPIVGVGACTAEGVIVYSAPNAFAAAYDVLRYNEQTYIMAEECAPGWDKIFIYTEWNSGYIGYVEARYIRSGVPDEAIDTVS